MSTVNVINTTDSRLGVLVRELNFKREWLAKDAVVKIDKEILEQLMYDNGFRYMIETGMLYIEDMEVKQELGIEPEEVSEPVNVIVLTDKERRYYMVNLSLNDFKEKVNQLNYEQINQLADYAIKNRLADFDKARVIKELCGKDVIKAIQLNDADKEN